MYDISRAGPLRPGDGDSGDGQTPARMTVHENDQGDVTVHIRLTVVDPARSALRSDVVLTAGPTSDVAEVRPLLLGAVGRDSPSELSLFVYGQPLD